MSTLSKIMDCSATPIHEDLDGWRKLSGDPSMTTWIDYTSPDGSTICGSWQASPGIYHASYSNWEFVHLIEGEILITPEDGEAVTLKPGDAFVVEPGFSGTWEIRKPVRKHFTIKIR